ncbi:serine-rich adhesin for platelets-like isoform X1 [Sinocyclocheilus grahami]|uniref:serine-rich adhesin for platelets-like isoform X1 n=1 Tax=Sinocyclocheilus grahami TaxID=75366 RepID=UPI0007AC7629|nr:PREDICTED: serine-rich adhesin for platelets-like isoform X1 [Sinocyclocheilus grahami]XP_016134322.1 PREDICTED: serine-rich adhesin for platelets-like isoform X1 [Sinocyclocheilus grahami]XP_016134324.1 PREDICTED: serine-rich adhesin for platelets-like isoform X1 [Sinocyclocheilus grahami]XP_016134325.1 PREDICTED: serine-rich adhesin for platelets-like isoform X1 [Sinocyclocheilus grahami]XP_016134326.1 PREDICTED: serine-rich adhesin for platelets-like isoform X1 [Sinocyclocheilus grahami]
MSTHDLKLQQSSCQSGVKASVTCFVPDQERLYTQTDKSRFQNVSEHEKLHPGPLAQHIHNKKDLETRTTASSPSLQLTGQQKSSRDLQIRQIILLRSKEDSSRTSEEQRKSARFTSTISISLPNRRNKKDTAEEKTLQATNSLYSTHEAIKNTANQNHTELRDVLSPTEQCGESTGELFKNRDGPKASFDEDSFTTLHQHGHNTPKQGQNTGIQHNIGLHEQTQIVHNGSQRHSTQPVCEVQTEFNKESGANDCRKNTATTPQYHSNLTSFEGDNGLKASTDSQFFAHYSEVVNQVLPLDSFPALHSDSTPEPEPGLFNPTSAMLTSALASVLPLPWSGRLQRPKQGCSEVQHEPQDCGQNVNPSTLFCQDRQQQPFLPSQRRPSEHMLANDSDMQLTAGTSYNCPDWQKENNSPNITTTIQPTRPIIKSSSVGMMYNNTDLHSFPTPLDTRQVPNLAHSEYRISNTGDEHEAFKSLSSKPTTSSLLLSLRRSNLRSSSADPTQSQTQMTSSVRSLTLPSRVVLKTPSFAHSVTADDQTPEYPDTPARTEEIAVSQFLFSHRIKSRVPLRKSLFLNKPETEIYQRLEASVARVEEERFPISTTKTGQLGILRAEQSSYSVFLRKYSNTEDIDPAEQNAANNTNLQNSNMTRQKVIPDTTISPKVLTNNVQQSGFNVQKLKSQSTHNIISSSSSGTGTFTDRLNYSPRKDSGGTSPTNVGHIYLDSKKYSQSSQSTMDLSSSLSPSRPLRSVRVPSIYSYLRESSPAVSTPSPSTTSSHIQRGETSPPKQDGGVTLQGDRKTLPSRFSFDFNPFVPQVQALQRNSYSSSSHIVPAQSLPPDFGRRSAPRLSTSPYFSLISSRPTLNNTLQELSSPPVSKTHTRSTSYDIVTTPADFIKGDPSSSLSTYTGIIRRPKEQLASPNRKQRTAVQDYTSALDNHKPAQPCLLQVAPDTSFVMERQSANISPHPRQPDTGSNNFCHQEHDGLMELQLDKGNAYPKHRLNEKDKYKLTVENETPLTAEKEIPAVHMHERLQEMQSSNSKKGLFSLRVNKDKEAVFSSASLPDKEVVSPQYLKTKRHSPVFKTSSRIDQMLNRLKLTFGVKRSNSSLDALPKKNKSPTQQPSDTETFESPKPEENTCSESHPEPSNYSLITDKHSLNSLSLLTFKKSENTLNMDEQNKSTAEINYSGCTREAPNSFLTTNKSSFASFGSLLPCTLKISEKTLNMDWQNRSTTEQKGSGCTWEAPNSSLTTDKAPFASFESLSPLTLKKSSENKLNVDQQKRHSDENGNHSYGRSFSPHRLKAQSMNRSATLPHYRKSSVGPPSPFYLFDFDSEEIQNDNVFNSPVSKKTNSLCESDYFSSLNSKSPVQQNLVRSHLSSSCADLKYGLHNGRSFSVSSVVSSRPSGPGRISTSSISDLSSLDDFVPKGDYTVVDSPMSSSHSPICDAKSITGKQSEPGYTDDLDLDHYDADPTPPPSPTMSSSPRRISQAPSVSSPMWTTPEKSPTRGILSSRSYTTSLTVFEESDSDTTTDDEYYLDNCDDAVETEL